MVDELFEHQDSLGGWRMDPMPPPNVVVQYARDIMSGDSPFPNKR
jgi:hypothetical protein